MEKDSHKWQSCAQIVRLWWEGAHVPNACRPTGYGAYATIDERGDFLHVCTDHNTEKWEHFPLAGSDPRILELVASVRAQ